MKPILISVSLTLLTSVEASIPHLVGRTGGPLKPGFGLSGDVHMSQTWSGEQTRLSSCHGD